MDKIQTNNSSEVPQVEELAQKKYNNVGSLYTQHNGGYIGGELYTLDGFDYVVAEDGNTYLYDREKSVLLLVTDESIKSKIEAMCKEDVEVSNARCDVADVLGGDSEILKGIIRLHLEYTGGSVDPVEKQGVTFYQVGRNASHEFYIGVKDGKKYVYTIGEDYTYFDADDPSNDKIGYKEDVYEVEKWGYLGHF